MRGKKNLSDIGRVVKVNDEEMLEVWDDGSCNDFVGTDSTIFPPFMSAEEGLWNYQPAMCRSLRAVHRDKSKYAGIRTNRFYIEFGDIANTPELQCFCREPDVCPLNGTMDLFPCVGAPIILSLPHFYGGNL